MYTALEYSAAYSISLFITGGRNTDDEFTTYFQLQIETKFS